MTTRLMDLAPRIGKENTFQLNFVTLTKETGTKRFMTNSKTIYSTKDGA